MAGSKKIKMTTLIFCAFCIAFLSACYNTSGDSDRSKSFLITSSNVSEDSLSGDDRSNNTTIIIEKPSSCFFADRVLDLEPIGADIAGTNSLCYNAATGTYQFSYQSGSTEIKYIIDTTSDSVKKGLIAVDAVLNDNPKIHAIADGGAQYRSSTYKIMTPKAFANAATVEFSHSMDKNGVHLIYTDTFEGITTSKEYFVTIKNKSLILEASSNNTNYKNGYTAFTAGTSTGIKNARAVSMVYAEDVPVIVVNDHYFLTSYIDKVLSNGTTKSPSNFAYKDSEEAQTGIITRYESNSEGTVNTLRERLYVTVSDSMLDCVYLTSAKKSQYRDELTDRVIFEEWGGTTYSSVNLISQRYALYSRLAESYSMDKIYYIDHVWQRDGYDISLPAHYPVSSIYGNQEEMIALINKLKNGYKWKTALHEDYWFMQPSDTNQYWKEAGVENRLVQDSEGKYKVGWTTGTGLSSWAIKPSDMIYYSNLESTKIKENYKTNGVFVDVSAAWSPNYLNLITLDAKSKTSRSLAQAVEETIAFFQNLKKIHRSSVASEGYDSNTEAYSTAYAGFVEAVERQIVDGDNARIMPDYELKYIRPLMANQGMGYHNRFSTDVSSAKVFDFDKYNTMALAYGHTGLFNNMLADVTDENYVNTYYMFQAIQSQYLDTNVSVENILYYDDNKSMSLEEAILKDYNFKKAKLHIQYSNGLEIYLNFSESNWQVTLNEHTYILDINGYAAENKSIGFLQYSCLKNGNRVDYVDCSVYTYANARNTMTDFGKFKTDKFIIIRKDKSDTKKLDISSLSIEKITFRGVTIGLDTNKPAKITLLYGESKPNLSYTTNTGYLTTHTIEMKSGLKAATTYYYKVVAVDLAGNHIESEVKQFTTSGKPGDELPKVLTPQENQPIKYSDHFSDINGDNGFYYYERLGAAFVPLEYDYTNMRWNGSGSYLGIGIDNFHSGFSTDAALGFRFPVDGTVVITYSTQRLGEKNDEDGTNFSILHNNRIMLPQEGNYVTLTGKTKLNNKITMAVKKGDFAYFITNKNGSLYYDNLSLDISFTYTKIN